MAEYAELSLADDVAAFFADPGRDDMASLYDRVRGEEPVHHSTVGPWIVSSYELARQVVTSKDFVRGTHRGVDANGRFRPAESYWEHTIVHLNEPDHTRLRSLAQHAFTKRAVDRLREQAEGIVARRLAELAPRGEMELRRDFSYPVTLEVICRMIGVPVEDGHRITRWLHALVTMLQHSATDEQRALADEAATEAMAFVGRLADERVQHPREDMITEFVQAEEAGDRLTRTELTSLTLEMVSAGHETTATMIPNALYTLLRHPDELARLRADPTLLPRAVDECLRWEQSARTSVGYVTARDVELGGVLIPKGERVSVWLAAANRDPAIFADPDRFDITRSPNRHLSFSAGIHFCLGHALARMEVQAALQGLLQLPGLELAGDVSWRREWVGVRGVNELRLRWSARR